MSGPDRGTSLGICSPKCRDGCEPGGKPGWWEHHAHGAGSGSMQSLPTDHF